MADDSEKKVKKVGPNHDRAVRAIALAHAVSLAERQNGGIEVTDYRFDADAIVAMAEKFRAFLTVPGAAGDYAIQEEDGTVRAMLSPTSTLVLPSPGIEALATELRELRRTIERVIVDDDDASKVPGL